MGAAINYVAVLCLSVTVLLYTNTLDCGLCFDDEKAIVKNVDLRPSTPWSNLLWDDFWGTPMESFKSHKSYRPLCVATFRLNYMLHELQPMGYHLVNVLLHGVVCYLYVQLCGVIFSEVWPALIAGLLFAVHPIHTEAVAGVVGRADVMAGLFYLTSIFAYKRAAKRSGTSYQNMFLCLLLVTCSALSKEVGITSVAVCLVYDFVFVQQLTVRSAIKLLNGHHKLPGHLKSFLKRFFALCCYVGVFMVMRLQLMKKQPVLGLDLNPAQGLSSPYRQLHWAYLGYFNSWLLFNPSKLSPEYAMGTIPLITSFTDLRNIATVVTFTVLALLGVFAMDKLKQENKIMLLGLAMIVFPFIPASNLFFPVGFVVAERVLYLPSMGFCLLVGYGVWYLSKSFHSLSFVGLLLLLVTHSTKTIYRNRDWHSEPVLYHAAIKTFPNNAKMLHNLATKYANTDTDLEFAEMLMRASTIAEPNYIHAHSDLGLIMYKQGRLEEAEEHYRHAVDLVYKGIGGNTSIPVSVKALKVFSRLAKILKLDSSRLQEAHDLLKDVIKKFPDFQYSYIYSEMGDVLIRMGRYSKAKIALEQAKEYDPKNRMAYSHLAKLHLEQGNVSLAEQSLRNGVAACGPHVELLYDLASMIHNNHHGNQERLLEAEKLLLYIVTATPNNTAAQHKLGVVQYDLQKFNDAQTAFLRALHISPHHIGALYDLARLYVAAGHCDPALRQLDVLLEVEPQHKEGLKLFEVCQNHKKGGT